MQKDIQTGVLNLVFIISSIIKHGINGINSNGILCNRSMAIAKENAPAAILALTSNHTHTSSPFPWNTHPKATRTLKHPNNPLSKYTLTIHTQLTKEINKQNPTTANKAQNHNTEILLLTFGMSMDCQYQWDAANYSLKAANLLRKANYSNQA